MKAVTIVASAALAMVLGAGPALAETCSGKWGGTVATTVTFQGGTKLRYCYRNECWNTTCWATRPGT